MKQRLALVIWILFIVGMPGCSPAVLNETQEATKPPLAEATSAPITTTAVTPLASSAEESIPGFLDTTFEVEGKAIQLVKGVSEVEAAPGSAAKVVTRYFGNESSGDLNGDGKEDVAFLIAQNSGGSGTFFYVVVALRTNAGYSGTNAMFLGDRIAPQTTSIENGVVVANYADRKPGEPFTTQPSVGVSRRFKIEDQNLIEVKP